MTNMRLDCTDNLSAKVFRMATVDNNIIIIFLFKNERLLLVNVSCSTANYFKFTQSVSLLSAGSFIFDLIDY